MSQLAAQRKGVASVADEYCAPVETDKAIQRVERKHRARHPGAARFEDPTLRKFAHDTTSAERRVWVGDAIASNPRGPRCSLRVRGRARGAGAARMSGAR